MIQLTLFDLSPNFTNRTTKSVTFRGKLTLPIHRWYRLTPSFSPRLANDIADHFELSGSDFVLDPFSGVGTVPLCMKVRGIPACSVEINPYLHFVGSVKTRTYTDISAIESVFSRFIAAYRAALEQVPFESKPEGYLKEHQADIPPINFPERWWSPGNLAQLVCLRKLAGCNRSPAMPQLLMNVPYETKHASDSYRYPQLPWAPRNAGCFLGFARLGWYGRRSVRRIPPDGNYNVVPRLLQRHRRKPRNPWESRGYGERSSGYAQLAASFQGETHHLDLLKMGVLGILIPVSNAKHNHVSLTFAKQPLGLVEVAGILDQQFRHMVADLRAVAELPKPEVTIYRGNSKELAKVLPKGPKISAVITSPPYPNRFSYARETRPPLFFFDFIESARAVGQRVHSHYVVMRRFQNLW